jgi:hypothetical protein
MLCEKFLPLLSEFLDGVLDADRAIQVNQHLGQCIPCRKEFNSLSALQKKLRSLDGVKTPEVLRRLVQHQLAKEPWQARVRNELERYWSIIRTTEAMWYATRALGTVMAFMFFVLMPNAITPYIVVQAQDAQRASITPTYYCLGQQPAYRHSVSRTLAKNFGMAPAPTQVLRGRTDPAAINDSYLWEYGRSISDAGEDDSFSVATTVDRNGAGKVETVLEQPFDKTLLTTFRELIASARFRPASENGQAVKSPLVFTFSKVFVSD